MGMELGTGEGEREESAGFEKNREVPCCCWVVFLFAGNWRCHCRVTAVLGVHRLNVEVNLSTL
ncbi:hypothetical protein TSUD_25300 [Trifolium subterraneum]|uniref:Uncharacterized protein n=1 Tax=Trifolium subterraneum TaxID=3900 RepID=A0A2Z6NXX2_TRISU|nr:hypothetical protein TSUD_25300 [Trifolium subterraneum]